MEEEETSSSSTAATSTTSTTSSTSTSSTISTATPNDHYRPAILPGEIRQLFSLPESIMYYIAMHPSNAEVYKKLIRTCKYFFNRNPILVVNQLWFDITENGVGEWRISMKNERTDRGVKIDLDEIQHKLWVTYDFSVAPSLEAIQFYKGEKAYENIYTSIIPKIYRCDAVRMYFQCQNIKFDDFVLLASKVEDLTFIWSTIYEGDDGENEVMLEKIIEKLLKIRKIEWHFYDPCECMSSNTVAELLKLQHVGNITHLHLDDVPEVFDVKALFQAIKMKHKNMKINLFYVNDMSEEFKQKINKITDEIISTKVFTYMPPRIDYYGLDQLKSKKINNIRNNIMYSDTKF